MKYIGKGPIGLWAIDLTYSDLNQVSSWANEGVMYMTLKDLMNGIGNDAQGLPLFDPKSALTRVQASQVIMNFGELLE
jgi:hypothetical protein